MNTIKIPKSFTLAGIEHTVEFVEEPTNCTALADYNSAQTLIRLHKKWQGQEVSEKQHLNSFIHEVVHSILTAYGYKNEDEDEKFVSALASGLCQVIQTSKFEEDEKTNTET